MQTSSKQTKGLAEVLLPLVVLVSPAKLDTLAKQPAHMQGRGHDVGALVSDVVLHARVGVYFQFAGL